jgi:hypothetical protein
VYGWDILLNRAGATNQPYRDISKNGRGNHRYQWAMYGPHNAVLSSVPWPLE